MKKKYFKPEMDVHELNLKCALLAGSNPGEQEDEEEYYPNDDYDYNGPLG